MTDSFFWVAYRILLCFLVPSCMWFVSLFKEGNSKKSGYFRRRAFAYTVVLFLTVDFIPLIYSSITNISSDPYQVRSSAILAIPWLILIWLGFKDDDNPLTGFFYCIWRPYRDENNSFINSSKSINNT